MVYFGWERGSEVENEKVLGKKKGYINELSPKSGQELCILKGSLESLANADPMLISQIDA